METSEEYVLSETKFCNSFGTCLDCGMARDSAVSLTQPACNVCMPAVECAYVCLCACCRNGSDCKMGDVSLGNLVEAQL